MANKYRPGDAVTIYDGNVIVPLTDDHLKEYKVKIPDGTPGIVRRVGLGGALYRVLTTGVASNGDRIRGTGSFSESALREA